MGNLPLSDKTGRAAMYVRMSTEHQQYSTENQADVIKKYAIQRDLVIVKHVRRLWQKWLDAIWPFGAP